MKFTTQKTYLFLLLLCFLSANISESGFPSILPETFIESIAKIIPALKPTIKLSPADLEKYATVLDKGVHKGKEKFEDFLDAYDYLEKYGYINNTDVETLEQLESAIAKIQQNYDLDVTRYLDQNTYEILSKPRCDVPDIFNGSIAKTKVDEKTSFKPWWRNGGTNLTYAFDPYYNVGGIIQALFKDAFNRWSNVTKLNFTKTTLTNRSEIYVKGSYDILIVFAKLDGKGGAVGGTLIMNDINVGIIYFDVKENWVLPNDNVDDNHMDFESNVMHQIGHLLGLGHSSKEEAVMYPIVLPKRKIELVNADDLQRIQQIYGDKSIDKSTAVDKSSANHQHSTFLNIVFVLAVDFWLLNFFDVCMFL